MIKLIAIDTDGTLLNSQGEIQASTKEAISMATTLTRCFTNKLTKTRPSSTSEMSKTFRKRARPSPRPALSAARNF